MSSRSSSPSSSSFASGCSSGHFEADAILQFTLSNPVSFDARHRISPPHMFGFELLFSFPNCSDVTFIMCVGFLTAMFPQTPQMCGCHLRAKCNEAHGPQYMQICTRRCSNDGRHAAPVCGRRRSRRSGLGYEWGMSRLKRVHVGRGCFLICMSSIMPSAHCAISTVAVRSPIGIHVGMVLYTVVPCRAGRPFCFTITIGSRRHWAVPCIQ